MSPTRAPVVTVRRAELGGGGRPSEDRIFTTDRAVVVLDGATQPEQAHNDGGWIAQQLGSELTGRLEDRPDDDLADMLAGSIRHVAATHGLRPSVSPSTTVTIVRWNAERVDTLVLCDSLVVAADRRGRVHQVRDDRLDAITTQLRRPHRGFDMTDAEAWRRLVEGQRRHRNRPDGYWVAEAVPEAAHHAMTASWPTADLAVVMAMTDGVSIGIERYAIPPDWPTAIDLATDDPARLLHTVHDAEASDPHGDRWPRSKRHDDKALAVIRFEPASRR